MMRIWSLAFISTLACGAAAFAQTAPAAPHEHGASGVVFPASAATFQRDALGRESSNGSISASYIHQADPGRVTANVTVDRLAAGDEACRKVADAERVSASRRAGVVFSLVPPDAAGWEAIAFGVNGSGRNGSQQRYYYCRDGWVVQFQFQHAPDLDAEALQANFLAAFPLPEKH